MQPALKTNHISTIKQITDEIISYILSWIIYQNFSNEILNINVIEVIENGMVTSRENVINGGYKTANTRPISASFSPFPSPSNESFSPSLPHPRFPQNAEFIFLDGSSSIPS